MTTAILAMRFVAVFSTVLIVSTALAEPIAPGRIRVIDADTIRLDGKKPDYRLVGFNAPDRGSRAACATENTLASAASRRLREILAGGNIDLQRVPCSCRAGTEGTKKCNQGRYCAILRVNGHDVGSTLIREGLATPFICGETNCPKLPRPWCRK
jgi:endonuclease YncB( thermonuclease family)